MATIAQFVVDLLARTQGFRRDMQQAANVVTGFGRTLNTVRAGVLGFVGFGGLSTLVTRTLDSAENLRNLSIRFGESTERLGRLRQVAFETGLQFNTVATAIQRLARRTAEARAGNAQLAETFEALGIDLDNFFRLKPIDQFAALATALAKVGDQGERIRLAFKLVDSEGVPAILRFTQAQNQLNKALEEAEAGAAAGRAAGTFAGVGEFFKRIVSAVGRIGNELIAPTIEGGGTDIRGAIERQRREFRGRQNTERSLESIDQTSKQQLRTLEQINAKAGPARAQ